MSTMEGDKGNTTDPAARKKGKTAAAAGTKKGKKKVVQMPQEQVDHILSYKPEVFPLLSDELLSSLTGVIDVDAVRAELAATAADFNTAQESQLREQELVRQEYITTGRVVYEISDDEGVGAAAPEIKIQSPPAQK